MKLTKIFSLLVATVALVGNIWTATAQDSKNEIVITTAAISDFSSTYTEFAWSNGGVDGKIYAYKSTTAGFQGKMQFNGSKTCYVNNTKETPNRITAVTMNKVKDSNSQEWTLYVGTEPLTSSNLESKGVALEKKSVEENTTWTVTGSYKYFYLKIHGSKAAYIEEIVITYGEPVKSAITVAECENGSVAVDVENPTEVEDGTVVTLTNTPAEGYVFVAYDVYKTGEEETKVDVKDGKFTMPTYGVTVSASFETPAELLSIAITKPATKTEFYTNTLFNHDGVEVTATMKRDGQEFTKDVTDKAVFSNPDMTKVGEQTVTVSYTEGEVTKETTYTITLVENPVKDLSGVYTSNVTLTAEGGTAASVDTCIIGGVKYAAVKAGRSKNPTDGAVVLTLPKGTIRLHYHAIAWNEKPLTITVTVGAMEPVEQALKADAGLQATSPYTIADDQTGNYYVIELGEPLAEETTVKFEGASRFAIFGVNVEIEGATAIENSEVEVKATKIVRNGQVIIVREGVEYDMMGARL